MSKRKEAALVDAAWDGDLATVRRLLAEGVPANARGHDHSALRGAVCAVKPSLVELLLEHGADPNESDDDGTLLHRAVDEDPGSLRAARVVRLLVQHGADLEARGFEGATPLHIAVRAAAQRHVLSRSSSFAGRMLSRLAGIVPGMTTVEPGDDGEAEGEPNPIAVIDTLLELGADIDARDSYGTTAIMIAVMEGEQKLAEELASRGASRDGESDSHLIKAVVAGDESLVRALLHKGANPNRRDPRLGSPLTLAAQEGNLQIVELLLAAGADVNLPEDDSPDGSFTPLTRAVYSGHLAVVQRLLVAGADPREPRVEGMRPLDYAKLGAREGHQRDKPWDELLAVLKQALAAAGGPGNLCLGDLITEPEVIAELRSANPAMGTLRWRRAEVAGIEFFESSALAGAPADWDKVRETAQRHGLAPVLAAWSIDDVEPEVAALEASINAVSLESGAARLDKAAGLWRRYAEDEAADAELSGDDEDDDEEGDEEESAAATLARLERGPIPAPRSGVQLRVSSPHLVLLRGPAALVPLIYRFGQEVLTPQEIASILVAWHERVGAELAAFAGATMEVVLPQPLADEQTIRRCAMEIMGVAPDLEDASSALAMAASRQWSFWWD